MLPNGRTAGLAAALSGLALLSAACSGAAGSPAGGPAATTGNSDTPRVGGTLIAAAEGAVGAMDNNVSPGGALTSRVKFHIYDALVNFDYSTEDVPQLVPGLAEKWETGADSLTWTFKLRPGVKFHDGTAFDADAYMFNVKRVTEKDFPLYQPLGAAGKASHYALIDKVEKVDDLTIKYTLKQPYARFLNDLTAQQIASPDALKKWGNDEFANHAAATGPFKFIKNESGVQFVMQRNEDYWGKKPYLDGIIIRPIPEAVTRVAALQAREVDFINVIHPDYLDQLKANPQLAISMIPVPNVWGFQFNSAKPPFNDVRVRRAMNLAVDREAMSRDLLKGVGIPASVYAPEGNDVYDPAVKSPWYKYDPAQAKALLTEAGYPNGFKVKFPMPTDGSFNIVPVPMAEFMAGNLKKNLNVDMEVELYEWQSYQAERNKKGRELNGAFISFSYNDNTFTTWGSMNPAGYNNPEVDKLVRQAMTSTNIEGYKKYHIQAEQLVMDEAQWLLVMQDTEPKAYWANKVKNFKRPKSANWVLTYTWLAQ